MPNEILGRRRRKKLWLSSDLCPITGFA